MTDHAAAAGFIAAKFVDGQLRVIGQPPALELARPDHGWRIYALVPTDRPLPTFAEQLAREMALGQIAYADPLPSQVRRAGDPEPEPFSVRAQAEHLRDYAQRTTLAAEVRRAGGAQVGDGSGK